MNDLRLVYIVGLCLAACELVEYLLVRTHDAEVFPPKLGWRLLRWLSIAACIGGIAVSIRPASWALFAYVAFLFVWLAWPRTVLVDSSTVSPCSLFGILPRSIPWGEASRVSSDWQEERLRAGLSLLWVFTGYSVTVMARDGKTIQHGVVNRGQGRFLDALRRYIPRDAFDAG